MFKPQFNSHFINSFHPNTLALIAKVLHIIIGLLIWQILLNFQSLAQTQIFDTQKTEILTKVLVKDLKLPFSFLEMPDGRLLITEKSGSIQILDLNNLKKTEVTGVPSVFHRGQAGLLDAVLDPNFLKNNKIYLSYIDINSGLSYLVISSFTLVNNALDQKKVLFKVNPALDININYGSRFAFDNFGLLYFSIGDRNQQKKAQDLSSPFGKLMRINTDGSIPKNNPFIAQSEALPEIYSYGHRNVQGLYFDKKSAKLWSSEHGPMGGDEINLIEIGQNYGWPLASFGRQYSGKLINKGATRYPGTIDSLWYFTPSVAPGDIIIYHGNEFSGWDNDLLMTAMKFSYVARLDITSKEKINSQEKLFQNHFIRPRDILQHSNSNIYLITDSGWLVEISAKN